ncbi:MFS transporter [Brevibacillus dissolubilis]|uniref:MFS transporter n=1 Tax=Brevibacillus dissolubilis TaxID=1844116 RepID=UPI001116091D|nr:MFS transporter [Brevibacillus dissolubilis]
MPSRRFTFWTLIVVVMIAGMSQGLTLPLLSIMLEERGVSSIANGLNAAALYIGVFLVSPWLETPIRRLGYRTTILIGLTLVTISTVLIPFFSSLTVWFILRFLMGVGDSSLHYSTQIWMTDITTPERRGRDISLYGLAYGVGFGIGPLGLKLEPFGLWAPFLALFAFNLIAFVMLSRIRNAYPQAITTTEGKKENKYAATVRLAWLALIPSFLYGYMEAGLNASFPVYAVRVGMTSDMLALILPSFVIGSLILQLPLGALSDRLGRKKVMASCALVGCAAFIAFPLAVHSLWTMMLLLGIAGAAVGSFYSMGMAYSADVLPAGMVPTAGVIASMNFSVASILAPNVNGYVLDYLRPDFMFTLLGILLGVFVLLSMLHRPKKVEQAGNVTVHQA